MFQGEQKIHVTVIIPAYNAGQYLSEAIDSVRAQTYSGNWELWVIDDASEDGTEQVAKAYQTRDARIHYYRQQKNQGVAAARNKGLELAAGNYVAFLDADDWWEPDKLEVQMRTLERTGAVLCCTGRELMHPDGTAAGRRIQVPEVITFKMLLRTNLIPCGSVIVQKKAASEFRFVHDELHEDYILWLRILKKYGSAAGVNRPMLKCRLSAGGKSRNKFRSARMHYGCYRYIGYGPIQSFYYMLFYMINGIRKYHL